MSQLLARLDAKIQSSTDPLVIAEARIRRSCYLSRIGYFHESREIIADLRKSYGAGQNGRISVWIMLAEGIAEIFEKISPAAKDRISRAQLIGLAIKDRELGAITSAWKAHIDFEESNFDSMIRSLKTAFELADVDNDDARCRIFILLSDCYFWLGDRERAQRWFLRCHEHAVKSGDQATIDALLYSRAAFGIARLRVQRCFSQLDAGLVSQIHLEILSAKNYQRMTRDLSLAHLTDLCEARVLFMKGEFSAAAALFRSIRSARPVAKNNFSEAMIDLEIGLCLQAEGKIDDALDLALPSLQLGFQELDLDDRLILAGARRFLAAADARFGDRLAADEEFNRLALEYESRSASLHAKVTELSEAFEDSMHGKSR